MKTIPYGKQSLNNDDILSVVEVLTSDYLTQGPQIEIFEKKVSEYCGAEYAVAVSNATAALHIACMVAGFGPGKKLWTSPNSFVASSNCGLYCGGEVDFVDIDAQTLNVSQDHFFKKIDKEKSPDIFIPVHFSGRAVELDVYQKIRIEKKIIIIEDASHSIGGSYLDGSRIGSCAKSDMTIFSFHPVKIITTGEGGMILTNNKEYYLKLKELRSHGITRDIERMKNVSHGPWYYEQTALGFNYRLTDMQAALGNSQMTRLNAFVEKRQALVQMYRKHLINKYIKLPDDKYDKLSSWHLFVVQIDFKSLKVCQVETFERMKDRKIGVNLHYIPIPAQKYYQDLGFNCKDFPVVMNYYSMAMTLPLYPEMIESDIIYISNSLKEILK